MEPNLTSKPAESKPASSSPILFGAIVALIGIAVIYLLKTNPASGIWQQGYDPVGRWYFSTMLAALPIVVLLGAIAVLRIKAHLAACAGLITALLVATVIFHMPVRLAFSAASYGAGYGIFPVCWIILPVIFLYELTVKTGTFVTLQESLTNITADSRLQLLLIASALGAFFAGTAGFGTPVAVCGAILISLGFRPLQAAGLSLLANTAPVAFGALGIHLGAVLRLLAAELVRKLHAELGDGAVRRAKVLGPGTHARNPGQRRVGGGRGPHDPSPLHKAHGSPGERRPPRPTGTPPAAARGAAPRSPTSSSQE